MAFKTYSGSCFFSLDGVPFVISEKWKPPKKVTLPLEFETSTPSEFLFLEYDSTVEELLLARFEAERQAEKLAAAAEVRKEASTGNKASAVALVEYVPTKDFFKSSDADVTNLQQKPGTERNAAVLIPHTHKKILDRLSAQNSAAYHVSNGNILVPTPIGNSVESVVTGTRQLTTDFDLKDFENEQDPFENLSLKVINDIEELDKVFLATSKSQSQISNSFTDDNQLSDSIDSEFLIEGAAKENSKLTSSGNAASSVIRNSGTNQVVASGWNVVESYLSPHSMSSIKYVHSSEAASRNDDSSFVMMPPSLNHAIIQNTSESRIPECILNGNLANSVLCSKSTGQAFGIEEHSQPQNGFAQSSKPIDFANDYGVAAQNLPRSSSKQIGFPNSDVPFSKMMTNTTWSVTPSNAAWPSLAVADNSNSKQSLEFNPHLFLYNDFGHFSNSKATLRSAKSNPDLSVVDNSSGIPFNSFGRHTPPIFETRSLMPERAHVGQNASAVSSSSVRIKENFLKKDPEKQSSYDDHLYSALSNEARNFVDFIVTMGFPKLQTIRAVHKLGIDEKLVLDHLCAFSKLIEKCYGSNDVENALFLFEGDLEKAEAYLKSAMTFKTMGFEEERITKALLECSLDEEKALDWLTS